MGIRDALNLRWYQNAIIKGKPMPFRRKKNDTTTARWKKFIEPLVVNGSVFIDFGGNAGYCCRKMVDKGFITYCVENDPAFVDCAEYWEEQDPKGVNVINRSAISYDFPCADIALMSYFTYWLTQEQLVDLEKKLREKVVNVIIVTRKKNHRDFLSSAKMEFLIKIFHNWEISKTLNGENPSIRLKNPNLETLGIDKVWYDYRVNPGDYDEKLLKDITANGIKNYCVVVKMKGKTIFEGWKP